MNVVRVVIISLSIFIEWSELCLRCIKGLRRNGEGAPVSKRDFGVVEPLVIKDGLPDGVLSINITILMLGEPLFSYSFILAL